MTQLALRWCGPTSRAACGWIERDGIGVAFRRTPTGQDASGREGAFFVHVLIWKAGEFPANLLAGLWDADVWVLRPPDHPPEKLAPIQTVDELGLAVAVRLEWEDVVCALGAHLENVAAGRRSAIALAEDAAFAYASAIARLLPSRFGLPSFSTFEEPSQELEYDMIATHEPHRHFERIAPGARPAQVWASAAETLIEAHDGVASAADVVSALAERAADLADFVTRLGDWTALETSPNRELRGGAVGVALAASDQRLLARMFARAAPVP